MANSTDDINRARLAQERGNLSYEAFSEKLGVSNVSYTFFYMTKGEKPTKRTKIGRETRKALGIVSEGLLYTRNRNDALNDYAIERGYSSWSEIGTLILAGRDDLVKEKEQGA